MVFKFLACIVQETKKSTRLHLASYMEKTYKFKNCSESCIKFIFRLSSALIGQFYPGANLWPAFQTILRITGGFRNNFRVTDIYRKREQAP
jgi:hypothetical protein